MQKTYYVYILSSRSRNLYTGVTSNLFRRVMEHKHSRIAGFTTRYRICRLVHLEEFAYIHDAIAREKEIKAWTRQKRLALIEEANPTWDDLAEQWDGKAVKRSADSSLRSE